MLKRLLPLALAPLCIATANADEAEIKKAMEAKLGVKVDGRYRQLNDNILQLENELYAPIRPKRAPRAGERTLTALEHRGIEYIELRTLDINPFTHLAISYQEVLFFPGGFGHWRWLLVMAVGSVLTFLAGYFVFDRMRDSFAEEV